MENNIKKEIKNYENIYEKKINNKTKIELENIIKSCIKQNTKLLKKIKINDIKIKKNYYNYNNNDNDNSLIEKINQFIPIYAKEFLDIFHLRYLAFDNRNYNLLIDKNKNKIELNYDNYDINSIILKYNRENIITASTRLVLDKEPLKLYSEFKFNREKGFNEIREKYKKEKKQTFNNITEISRSSILPEYQKKGAEFRELFKVVYYLKNILNIGEYITAIAKEDYNLYKKIGFEIIKEDFAYEKIEKQVLYLSWNPNLENRFFKKVFLR